MGADDIDAVRAELSAGFIATARLGDAEIDLSEPTTDALFNQALGSTGSVDILVCNQARSGRDGALGPAADLLLRRDSPRPSQSYR